MTNFQTTLASCHNHEVVSGKIGVETLVLAEWLCLHDKEHQIEKMINSMLSTVEQKDKIDYRPCLIYLGQGL